MHSPAVSNAFLKSVGASPRSRRRNPKNNNRKIRAKLLEKDPYCYYCGRPLTLNDSTLDHTIPVSKGGTDKYAVLACEPCNNDKGDKIIMPWNILRELE